MSRFTIKSIHPNLKQLQLLLEIFTHTVLCMHIHVHMTSDQVTAHTDTHTQTHTMHTIHIKSVFNYI